MDKRKSRLFAALLMAVFMMTSVFAAPANVYAAEETKKPNIEVEAKTKNSITLKVEEGYEYAIQITKDKKTEWKWAEDSQYTEDEDTHKRIGVTFSKLEEGKTYIFGKRAQGTADGEILTQKVELKITESEEASKKSDAPATESTEPAIESTEPATESTEPATESTEPATESTKSTEEATTQSSNQDVELPKETEPPVSVKGPKKAPANGETESKETESKESESKQESETNPANNNSNGTVPKESESKQESITTKLAPAAAAPAKPEVASFTDTAVQLKAVEDQEYALLNGDKAESWNDTGIFENLKPDTEYNFVTRVKYDPSTADESKMSEAVTVHTKISAAAAPAIPKMASRTETSITLAAIENGEYGLVQMDAVAENSEGIAAQSEENILWQESPEFTGLNPGTDYVFKVRMKFDAATAMESLASESFTYQTLVPFEGSTVTGVAMDGSYVSGTKLTATAVGNGMDNVNPVEGDSRWIPRTWNWGQSSFNSWKENYTIPFTLVEVGNYRLSVDFEREDYIGGAWKATGVVQTYIISFKVTAAPVTQYTITASSSGNGTINPQGNITAEHGKDYTFTFAPNNGFKIAKVYVDGIETKVENNKYTFKAVSANHTISVTFEQARKLDSPKTGDSMNMPLVFGVLIVSGVLLVGIIAYNQRKKKSSK